MLLTMDHIFSQVVTFLAALLWPDVCCLFGCIPTSKPNLTTNWEDYDLGRIIGHDRYNFYLLRRMLNIDDGERRRWDSDVE